MSHLGHVQEALDEIACFQCAQLSQDQIALLQLAALQTIAEASEAGGETAPERFPEMGVENEPAQFVVAMAAPGRMLVGLCTQNSGGPLYLQMFDETAEPTPGDVPLQVTPIPNEIQSGWDYSPAGYPLNNGLVLALSTSIFEYQPAAIGNVGLFTVTYR